MINLLIDSSRRNLELALTCQDKIIEKIITESYGKHSNYLLNTLNDILNKNDLSIYEVDNIIVLNGPGSFTGVRVGVTISKVIAWTLSKKLYEISTLDALSIHADDEVVISVFFDKKDSSYVGIYENDEINDYMMLDDERLNIKNKNITIVSYDNNLFVESLKEKLENKNTVRIKIIESYDVLKVIEKAMKNEPIKPHLSKPIYLKKIDAEKKL